MGKDKKGQGSPRRSGDNRKREPSPSSEDFGDSEYSEEEFSSKSEGSPVYAPPPSSDDSDDSQGIAAEVWTYIRFIKRARLEGTDELEVSSDEENSSDSSEEGSSGDGDDEGDSGDGGDGGDGGDDGSKGGGGDGSGKGGDDGKGSNSKAGGKAPLA
jgi:hypothetical protein